MLRLAETQVLSALHTQSKYTHLQCKKNQNIDITFTIFKCCAWTCSSLAIKWHCIDPCMSPLSSVWPSPPWLQYLLIKPAKFCKWWTSMSWRTPCPLLTHLLPLLSLHPFAFVNVTWRDSFVNNPPRAVSFLSVCPSHLILPSSCPISANSAEEAVVSVRLEGSLKTWRRIWAQPRCIQVQLFFQPKGGLSKSLHLLLFSCDTLVHKLPIHGRVALDAFCPCRTSLAFALYQF